MMNIIITEDLQDVLKFTKTKKSPVVCDIETTALTVGKGHIICIAFGKLKNDDVLVWYPKEESDISQLTLHRAVFHNASFDQRWLRHYGARVTTYWDTMLMAHLLDENHPIGLKDLGQRLLGYEDWSEDNISSLEDVPRDQITEYVAKDIHVTRELLKWQRAKIKAGLKPGENPVYIMRSIMIPAIEPLTQMEMNKMPVRMDRLEVVKTHVEKKLAKIDHKLDSMIPPREELPEFLQKTTPKWGSTNWTRWWLYEYQGAMCPNRGKPTKHFPEGSPSLSQETLSKIDHPAARLLSERSTLYKLLTGFLIPLCDRAVDGRVPTSFKLTGTVTGRLSSSSPAADNPGINSQQIPREKMIRNLFGEKGMAWIEADYSQLELRVAAVMANDHNMIKIFSEDGDIHQYMAERLVKGGEVTKTHRTLAKGVNFGFLYGMQSKHFADYLQQSYGVITSPAEAEAFREEYFTTFSELPKWHRRQRDKVLKYGGVSNEFGRFRHLPKVYNSDFWVAEAAFRQAINSPVQSTGSDFMLISLARIASDLRLQQLGVKLITTVHDSVCLTVPYRNAKKAGRIIKEIMEKADDTCERKFFLKADVTITRFWGGKALAEF